MYDYDVDIMMLGHFAKDRLVVDSTSKIASGGAVYYGSVALRRIGVRVAVVTRLHPDDLPRLDELKREGVEVFATAAPETSGIENIYDQPTWIGVSADRWASPAPSGERRSPTCRPRCAW